MKAGFVTGASKTRIMKSVNGGHGWYQFMSRDSLGSGATYVCENVLEMIIPDELVGIRGYVAKTTNSGDTGTLYQWTPPVFTGGIVTYIIIDTLGYASVSLHRYGAIH